MGFESVRPQQVKYWGALRFGEGVPIIRVMASRKAKPQSTARKSEQPRESHETDRQPELFETERRREVSQPEQQSESSESEQAHASSEPHASNEEETLNSSHPEAKELFDLAIKLKALAPWGWMEETDVFGVENPDTGELGFVSIMGTLGEHEAVALYLGAEGLYAFVDLIEDEAAPAESLIQIRHVQAAFSDRQYLEKEDRDLIKQLGLKFRGANAWPMFRSYRPGYLPWFVTVAEARFLIYALSATLDLATRVLDEADPIRPTGRVEKGGHLVLAARKEGDGLVWEDQVRVVTRPKAEAIRVSLDAVLLDELKRVTLTELEFEVDLQIAPAKIGTAGVRPMALYIVIVADRASGFLFGIEVMTAESSLAAMRARVPNVVGKFLLQHRIVPKRMIVRSDSMRQLLRPFTQSLNIELVQADELPSIDEAAESMGEWMRGGGI